MIPSNYSYIQGFCRKFLHIIQPESIQDGFNISSRDSNVIHVDLVSSILLRGTIRRDVSMVEGAVTQGNLDPVARIGVVQTLAGRAEVLGRAGLVLSSSELSESQTGEETVVHRHLLLRILLGMRAHKTSLGRWPRELGRCRDLITFRLVRVVSSLTAVWAVLPGVLLGGTFSPCQLFDLCYCTVHSGMILFDMSGEVRLSIYYFITFLTFNSELYASFKCFFR